MAHIYLAIAIIAEVIATSSLKAAEGFTKLGPSLVVIIGFGVSFYCLSFALKTIPIGIAYAIWSGLGIVMISIIGLLVYGQKLDMPAVIGIAFIIAGVAVMNLFSNSVAH